MLIFTNCLYSQIVRKKQFAPNMDNVQIYVKCPLLQIVGYSLDVTNQTLVVVNVDLLRMTPPISIKQRNNIILIQCTHLSWICVIMNKLQIYKITRYQCHWNYCHFRLYLQIICHKWLKNKKYSTVSKKVIQFGRFFRKVIPFRGHKCFVASILM